jgi:hypothetical protein
LGYSLVAVGHHSNSTIGYPAEVHFELLVAGNIHLSLGLLGGAPVVVRAESPIGDRCEIARAIRGKSGIDKTSNIIDSSSKSSHITAEYLVNRSLSFFKAL